MNFGCQNMVDPIRRVLMKHPREAYQNQNSLNDKSPQLNYYGIPNFNKAIAHYESFLELIASFGIEIHFLPIDESTSLDSVYTHDPCVITNSGVILCSMGKEARSSEPDAAKAYFESIDIPVLGKIEAPGTLEGGDIVWLNERIVAVGEGYRSNAEGIQQFKALLGNLVDEVMSVPLPHWTGPGDCLHLMSNISPIDHDLYLVYSRLIPVPFRKYLLHQQIRLIEVPDKEYDSMGCNVLTLAPRKVIMLESNPITRQLLEREGVEVHTYDGSEISLKGAGGPTCLTRPFLRSAS